MNQPFHYLHQDNLTIGSRGAAFVDLSHEIVSGATAYPGLPQPQLTSYLTHERSKEFYAPGYSFHIGTLCLVGSTATYLDVPFHAFPDGYDLTSLDLRHVADVPATVVDAGDQEIRPECFDGAELAGRAVLIRTGWSRHWGQETYSNGRHPHLSATAARLLAKSGVSVVGIDSLNVDDTRTGSRPAHYALLGAGIPVVEHLTNLTALPDGELRFTAIPVKVRGLGTFPVRAFATLPDGP